jgi:hypothetical protein
MPAYAATIHKSQGSEYPAVVIPVATQHYPMLQRNLLYTGVTGGKPLLERRDRCRADHSPIGDHTDLVDAKARAQTRDDGNEPCHICGIAGHRNEANGRSLPSSTIPRMICLRWGR